MARRELAYQFSDAQLKAPIDGALESSLTLDQAHARVAAASAYSEKEGEHGTTRRRELFAHASTVLEYIVSAGSFWRLQR